MRTHRYLFVRSLIVLLSIFLATFFVACSHQNSNKPHPQAIKGVIDLTTWDFEKDGQVKLDGEWEFYWQKFKEDIKPSDKAGFVQTGAWNSYRDKGTAIGGLGYGTYKLKILLRQSSQNLAMRTGYWNTSAKIYLPTGRHNIGYPGRIRTDTQPISRNDILDLEMGVQSIVITVETANFFHHRGGMLAAPVIDIAERLRTDVSRNRLWQGMLLAAFLFFGLYHFGLHLIRRDRATFWFAMFCILFALRTAITGEKVVHLWFPDIDFRILMLFEYLCMFLTVASDAMLLHSLFPNEFPRRIRNIVVGYCLAYCTTIILPIELCSQAIIGFQIPMVIFVFVNIAVAIRAVLRRKPTSTTYLFGFLILAAGIFADTAMSILFSLSTPFISIGLVGFIFAQGIVILRRFALALQTSEDLTVHLEQKVEDRTNEITKQKEEIERMSDCLKDQNTSLEAEVQRRTQEVLAVQEVTILAMTSLAETRDNDTGNHIRRTQLYVRALAEKLRRHPRFSNFLDDDKNIDLLFKSAPLHDIGKVGIPDHILLKPGRFTEEEFEIMKTHCKLGRDAIIAAERRLGLELPFLSFAKEIAYAHQEKWDGTGYPEGLACDDIPISGRLMALADVYDALICRRVYKEGLPHEKAVEIIMQGKGTHFDPDMVDAFMDIADEFNQISKHYEDTYE